jgi:hypothetical protein
LIAAAASKGGFTQILSFVFFKKKKKKALGTQRIAFISVCIHISAFSGPERKVERQTNPGTCCAHRSP